jgi:uncharacterized membrane protein
MIVEQLIKNKEVYKIGSLSERPVRSLLKSASWRVLGTLDTILITWFVTGELTVAFSVGSIELITKMGLYFFHERIWDGIKWGKK